MSDDERLARACPGWRMCVDPMFGYWLLPPDGDSALIATQRAFEDWLARQERWRRIEVEETDRAAA